MIPSRSLTGVEIKELAETSITGVRVKKVLNKENSLNIPPMEINTYKLTFS